MAANSDCQWCAQVLLGAQPFSNCSHHRICDKCRINKRTCQSACPLCWYNNGSVFINAYNYCAVCYKNVQPNDVISVCDQQHKRCSNCPPSGCILCSLSRLRSWNNCSLDDLPPDVHRIMEVCEQIERRFEETQRPILNRQDSSMAMDVDMNPVPVQNSPTAKAETQNNDCTICLDDLDATQVTLPICQHRFHRDCIEKWFQSSGKQSCPTCGHLYGITRGPQPLGEMKIKYISTVLPGFPSIPYAPNEGPTIEITYNIPSGVQDSRHPQPGQPFMGTVRTAYLPNNPEGKYVLQLLQRAFNDQHVFTIGISSTTGKDNVVVWNDIHHKTQITGGSDQYGYPDPTYLNRVCQELATKGYK